MENKNIYDNRQNQVMAALDIEEIKNQLKNLFENNQKEKESFRLKILNISMQYALRHCSPESIIKCGLQAVSLGLSLEGGQGYVVNYGGQAQFDCGYKGWQVLAKRAGYSVIADVVYSCDEFMQNGFGFDKQIIFNPNFLERKGHDDRWARENLSGVIVSIMEDENKNKTIAFIDSAMIFKIIGSSPSMQSEKGKRFSPHENWAEQMFAAKAIKHVLSKFAIDISKSSQLNEAIQIVNSAESLAQQNNNKEEFYSQERFEENFPKWKEVVKTGRKTAIAIITHLSNSFKLTPEQIEKAMELKKYEPIDAEDAGVSKC